MLDGYCRPQENSSENTTGLDTCFLNSQVFPHVHKQKFRVAARLLGVRLIIIIIIMIIINRFYFFHLAESRAGGRCNSNADAHFTVSQERVKQFPIGTIKPFSTFSVSTSRWGLAQRQRYEENWAGERRKRCVQ